MAGFLNTIQLETTSTSGTLTSEQLATLQESKTNYIVYGTELFKLVDNNTSGDTLIYTCSTNDSGTLKVKSITVTISTLAWTYSELSSGGSGEAQIEKLDLVVGDPEVIYDTTDGITITSQGQITQGGTTYNVDVEQNIPIIAGEGITIDASEDGKSIVVNKEAKYQHNIYLTDNLYGILSFSIINNNEQNYTLPTEISEYLFNKGFTNRSTIYPAQGLLTKGVRFYIGIYATNNTLHYYGVDTSTQVVGSVQQTTATIVDKVVEL